MKNCLVLHFLLTRKRNHAADGARRTDDKQEISHLGVRTGVRADGAGISADNCAVIRRDRRRKGRHGFKRPAQKRAACQRAPGHFHTGRAGLCADRCAQREKSAVMAAISHACGLKTPAHGLVMSLPVDETLGLEE